MRRVYQSTLLEGEDAKDSVENGCGVGLEPMEPWLEEIDTEGNPFGSKENAENDSPFWEWNKSSEAEWNALLAVENERILLSG